MWGLTVDEAMPAVELWPDNAMAVEAFDAMSTQWRAGSSGPIGLDYGVLPTVLRMVRAPRQEWRELFDAIRVMEDAALETMRAALQKARP